MNQIPTHRPPSPRPQGQPTSRPPKPKYQGRPIRLPKKCAPPKALVIATTLTAILLVISIMTLSVALLVGPTNNFDNDSGGKKDKTKVETQTQTEPSVTAKFLTFPSKTASGSYLSTSSSTVVTNDSQLKSAAAILVDMQTNTSLFERFSDATVYPASMTKVMTILVACELATDPTELLTITPQMITDLQESGGASTLGGWQAGDQITVEDALFLVNYKSDTVACWLLANRFGGSEKGFVAKMNQKAQSMGLTGTNFVNCTGLHNDNHYTTCREMAAIMQAAMNNPAAKKVITEYQEYTIQVYRDGTPNRTASMFAAWYSTRLQDNNYVGDGSDMRIRGGKTGKEDIPSNCFVTVAENGGKWYVCVTVGRISQSEPSVAMHASTTDARYLYSHYVNGSTRSWDTLRLLLK